MMDVNKFIWTEWHVAELKRRAGSRETAQTVATSWGISRNAVLGKADRIGLRFNSDGKAHLRAPHPVRTPVRKVVLSRVKCIPLPKIAKPKVAAAHPVVKPAKATETLIFPPRTTPLVSIMELKDGVCRFPIGDPRDDDFGYCGAQTPDDGGPYCCEHRQIAYTGKAFPSSGRPFKLSPIGLPRIVYEVAK